MTKKDVVGSFGQISLLVERQVTPKVLNGTMAVIEITSKEIFIGKGGNYKIRWKDVTQLDVDDEGFDLQSTRHRVQASDPHRKEWKKCRSYLEKYWNKRLEKDRKKEREVEEQQRLTIKPRTTFRKTYATYSKRKSRFETFLNKNEGTNAWDSEDDDNVFNHQRPKRSRLEDLENPPQQDENDEEMAEESEEHSVRGDLEDIAMENDQVVKDATDDDATMPPPDDEEDAAPLEDDADEDHQDKASVADDESAVAKPLPVSASKSRSRRRLFKRKQAKVDDESDDDELFNDSVVTTPQKARRIVSPATAGTTRLEDDEDEDFDQGTTSNQEQPEEEDDEDRSGLQNISNFFQSKGAESSPQKKLETNTPSSSPSKKQTKRQSNDFFARRKAAKPTAPSNSPANSDDESTVPPATFTKQKRTETDFFARREAANNRTTPIDSPTSNSDVSTVVPTPATTQQTEVDDGENDASIVSTPKQAKRNFFAAHKPAVEEEDPIVDSPSATSTVVDRPVFSAPKRLFKNTYGRRSQPSTSTASMALQLADLSSPNRPSPRPTTPARSPFGTNANAKPTPASRSTNPPTAPLSKWRGLRNLGNSCYMNASLQMLYSVPHFIEAIRKSKDGRRLVSSVSRLWQDLQDYSSKRGSATPRAIKSAVDDNTDRFQGFHQRDAHEFLGHLLDQLHEELERPHEKLVSVDDAPEGEEATLVEEKKAEEEDQGDKEIEEAKTEKKEEELATDSFFRLNVEVCLKCKSCGYSRTKEEMYRYLSIDIDQEGVRDGDAQRTVEKCLDSFFQPEDREIKCEKCEEGQIATQTMRVLSRPTTLLLHLKRFVLVEKEHAIDDTENQTGNARPPFEMTFQKNKAPVSLSESLSLNPYTADDSQHSEGAYKLRSVVYHLGSTANSGHYTADAMRSDPEDDDDKPTWVSYDDGLTSETSLEKIRESRSNQKAAYMLLYNLEK